MKSSIYTRTGDSGDTSLVGGDRIGKDSGRLEAYGTIDELSSNIGLLMASKGIPEEIRGQLADVLNVLFEVGGYLATPVKEDPAPALADIGSHTARLEGWIDTLDEQTPKLNSFILPGGSEESARAHVARTVCRRAERLIIALGRAEYVDPEVVAYLNRLSDYLFVAARYANFINGVSDIPWHPRAK